MQKELQDLLGEELVKQIEEKITGTLELKNIVSTAKGEYVPRDVMNQEIEKKSSRFEGEIESLNGQLEERDKDLKKIQKKLEGSEDAAGKIKELQTAVGEMQSKNEEDGVAHKAEVAKVRKQAEVKVQLIKAGAVHPELLVDKIDISKVTELNDGNFAGIKEQITLLKEGDYKDQFGEIVVDGEEPDGSGKSSKPKSKVMAELEKRYDEVCKTFGQSSAQAISVKNEMFKEQMTSTAESKSEKT